VSTARVYSLKILYCPLRVACWQLEHRLRVEEVILAVAAPLVLAPRLELVRPHGLPSERVLVADLHFLGNDVDADAADARRGVREVLVDERLAQADRFEDLCAAVALERGDAHLGHHLQHTFVERLDVVLDRDVCRSIPDTIPCRIMSSMGLERHIWD
jgi:hypothetical protein